MENCLVTKLKGTVQNDNLPYFGYLIATLTGDHVGGYVFRGTGILKLIGATFISTGTDEYTLSPTTDCHVNNDQNNPTIVRDVADAEVKILVPKYTINEYRQWSGQPVDLGELKYSTGLKNIEIASVATVGDISSLAGLTSLNNLLISGYQVIGDISSLAGLTSLIRVSLIGTNVQGNVNSLVTLVNLKELRLNGIKGLVGNAALLGSLTQLTVFTVPATKNVTLSIEEFVTNARNAGRTTGSVSLPWVGAVTCTFNESSVPNKESNSLSWTASTITFNDVTIDA